VTGLPPGEYLIAAAAAPTDAKSRARLTERDVLEDLSTVATRVMLAEGQRQVMDVKRIRH
jgi:hypothetical protein